MSSKIQQILLKQHKAFLSREYNLGRTDNITEWVESELIARSSISQQSKFAFYEAQKTLVAEFIENNNYNGVVILMQAIDHASFESKYGLCNVNLNKFKTNQCVVLAKAIIEAEEHLTTETLLHRCLGRMLYNKHRKQQESDSAVSRPLLMEKIPRALSIVRFKTPGRVSELRESGESSSVEAKRGSNDERGTKTEKLQPGSVEQEQKSKSDFSGLKVAFAAIMHKLQAHVIKEDSPETDGDVASTSESSTREQGDHSAAGEPNSETRGDSPKGGSSEGANVDEVCDERGDCATVQVPAADTGAVETDVEKVDRNDPESDQNKSLKQETDPNSL